MEITEYERLVSSETQVLQSKMTRAIDAAMNSIQTKQSELMAEIKSDPRKNAIRKKNIKLNLQISIEKEKYPGPVTVDQFLVTSLAAGPVVAGSLVLTGLYEELKKK